MAKDETRFLGLECGGTRTVALLVDAGGRILKRLEAGPANLRLISDAALATQFRSLRRQMPWPAAIGVGMAGARDASDRARVRRILESVWSGVPVRVEHDLESALAAAGPIDSGLTARIVILSGTGSCCYGRNRQDATAKVGGWGHQLGDRGSGYDIAFTALRTLVREFDHEGRWGGLGQRVSRRLLLNEPDELIAWMQSATKSDLAALAPEVFAAAARGDRLARGVLDEMAEKLADDAVACARRLARRGRQLEFVVAGGVLLKQPGFVRALSRHLRQRWPGARVRSLLRESAAGAVALAQAAFGSTALKPQQRSRASGRGNFPHEAAATNVSRSKARIPLPPASRRPSPTELRNPRSLHLDRMPLSQAISLMIEEDATIANALRTNRAPIARLIRAVVSALRRGGRLFYVGAGTSGRLGVLDASECPPTFRTPPDLVQGIIAGGAPALVSAVEGAEDDVDAGSSAIRVRGVKRSDVVVGLAASGRTPFVWGALAEAKRQGATTALVCCNPRLRFARGQRPGVVVALDVGPEILTGSTRLKAGTATKLVLNMVTTLAMVKLGKVRSNLMVDLNPSNTKLRDRAVRIVCELTDANAGQARTALARTGWVVKSAVKRLRKPARRL